MVNIILSSPLCACQRENKHTHTHTEVHTRTPLILSPVCLQLSWFQILVPTHFCWNNIHSLKCYLAFFLSFFNIYLFWLCWVSVSVRAFLWLQSMGPTLVAVHGLPIAMVSLVGEHKLLGAPASVVVTHQLSCSTARGVFPDKGSDPCLLQF